MSGHVEAAWERHKLEEIEKSTTVGLEAETVRWFPMDVLKVDMTVSGNRQTLYCVPAKESVNEATGASEILWTLRRDDGGMVSRDLFLPLADTVQAAQARMADRFKAAPMEFGPGTTLSANEDLSMMFAVVSDLGDADRRDMSYLDWLTDTLPVIRAHSGDNGVRVDHCYNEYQELKRAVAERLM